MKNIKSLFISLVLIGSVSVIGAAETVKAAPGAALYVYTINNTVRPAPDADPITVIVDKSSMFSGNLRNNPETQALFKQNLFIVWKGYLAIPTKGTYTFSASFESDYGSDNNVIVQVNGKDLLMISQIKRPYKMNDSRSVMLEKGDYEITIIHRAVHNGAFSLRMWNKNNPLKKLNITPAVLLHAE